MRCLVGGEIQAPPTEHQQRLYRDTRIRSHKRQVRFTQGIPEMNNFLLCTLLWVLAFANSAHSDPSNHTSAASSSNEDAERPPDWQSGGLSPTSPVSKSAVRPVRELIERWCAAYGDLDEKKLAALESPNIEVVDRFGALHVAKQRPDEERFWAEGFEMIHRKDFHPVCTIEEIRSTRPDVMIVHAEISYSGGIPLKGGECIPPFSEIHTFLVSKDEAVWQIAVHDITTRALQ
jgi:ketosteroid isomerase-like protein